MAKIRLEDTIAALATPAGEGGISVIRLSGPQAFSIAEKMFRLKTGKVLSACAPQTVHFGEVINGQGEVLDQALASLFRTPHSFTGEDVIEISVHGGMIVTRKVLELIYHTGARPAEPGEFTRRAFINGKIDLTQAEAVLDLIKARSDRALEAATHQLAGKLSKIFRSLKDELMKMYAHMEAFLDFPEEDLEIFSDTRFHQKFQDLAHEMEKLIAGFKRGILIREGTTLALVGKRNAGKSSLFNALLARDRAIVSEVPGTTRDVLEEGIEIQGWYLRLLDTAGLAQSSGDSVERIGMERTRQTLERTGIFIFVLDASHAWDHEDDYVLEHIPEDKTLCVVMNKSDQPQRINPKIVCEKTRGAKSVCLSAVTREGLDQLENLIAELLRSGPSEIESEQVTRLRHKNGLERALKALQKSEQAFLRRESLDLVILDLKQALDEMKELIGEIYSEDLLDVIFSEFCIGK